MEKIPQYTITALQERFQLEGGKRDYFFLEPDNFHMLPKEPYRTETYGIGLYRKSTIKLKTGLINHTVKGPSIITMGPTVIRSWMKPIKKNVNIMPSFLTLSQATTTLKAEGYVEDSYLMKLNGCGCLQRLFSFFSFKWPFLFKVYYLVTNVKIYLLI